MSKPTRVVILGGGFAGVAAGKALAKDPSIQVTLIDRSSFHIFHAALYEVATEEITRDTVTIPLTQIFQGSDVKIIRREVKKIDKAKKKVYLAGGEALEYDYLVISLGAETNDFGIKGVKEHAFSFREFKETVLLRDNIRTTFHLADERNKEHLDMVICGGGFSGVELAAELRCHLESLDLEYPYDKVCIILLEAGSQILPGMPKEVVEIAEKKLKELKVELRLGDPVAEVKRDGVRLKSGAWVGSDLTIWTAGTRPNAIASETGLPVDEKGRPVVNEFLSVLGFPEIYVAGDLAGYTDPKTGRGIAPQAHYAIQMGKLSGENIIRAHRGLTPKAFQPDPLDILIPVGHNYAIGFLNGRVSSGWWPSFLRKLVEFRYLVSLFGAFKAWPIFWAEVKVMTD